jgi:thymidylate kinase
MFKRKRLFQSQSDIRAAAEIAMEVYQNHNVSYNISDISPDLIRILKENAVPIVYLCSASKELINFDSQPDLKEEFEKYNTWKEEFIKVSTIFLQNDIDYIFIKTPSFFPYTSGNLDVLVKEKDFSKAGNLLESNGFIKLKNIREFDIKWIYKKFDKGEEVLPVHLHGRVFWGGTFLDSESIWKNRPKEPTEGIVFTLSPEDCVLTTLAHAFYENAGVRTLDLSIIKYLIEDKKIDWEYLKAIADRYKWIDGFYSSLLIYEYLHKNIFENELFPPEIIREAKNFVDKNWFLRIIVPKVLQSRIMMPFYIPIVLSKTLAYKKILRYDEYGGKIQRALIVIKGILEGIQRNYLNIEFQKPMFITLSGLDGSGKTSYANALNRAFENSGIKTEYIWARPGSSKMLQLVTKIFKKYKSKPKSSKNHVSPCDDFIRRKNMFRKRWIITLWHIMNILYFCTFYNFKVRKAIIKGKVTICDRYIPDIFVDLYTHNTNKNTNENFGIASLKFLSWCLPKPHMNILLKVSPETALARSKEKDCMEYLYRQDELYKHISEMLNLEIVDAEREFPDICNPVVKKMLESYYKRI